ncbi:hypothetical protein CANARDRAFT_26048 [[Candida] arabinofermentans NRRL YB-2248]|uniref:Fe2OG dioxygenase domain-containing protein n=1 Tax=[Candida] arabinofermentans NRRL YB-2248 TaxID=983967 RepID=A0A1E4T869_9ASCO|nr:hypothetical protein CANARDRAFT_26048 [[Candida] arabinofermentans NRRL YB-2248]
MTCKDYLTGAHSHDVPEGTINIEVHNILTQIKKNPNLNLDQLFDPEKHLSFKDEYFESTKKFTLKQLGIEKTHTTPINEFGATYPFPLLTEEAVEIMKWEAFQKENVKKYGRLTNSDFSLQTNRLDFHIGGYVNKGKAPFTESFYAHPRVNEIFSRFIGIDVEKCYNYDTNHVNVALADSSLPTYESSECLKENDQNNNRTERDVQSAASILGQHYDSTQIAAVIMWECPIGSGGETIIIRGDETPLVIPNNSEPGSCTLLQGRVIRHIATKAESNSNRIATVCGYCPADRSILDTSVLTSVRPSILPRSLHDQFYSEWFEFRFKRLENCLNAKRDSLMKQFENGVQFDQLAMINFVKECENYLQESWKEMEVVCNEPFPPPLFLTPYDDL